MIERREKPISVSIHGLGGQGGGVLGDWLIDVAEHCDYLCQATSVPGVAQRTGATVYYLEFHSREAAATRGVGPVMALMPMPGDVDLVVASELMEAGRAVSRGVVTRDRTTLIASSHRVFAIAEKSALGDGIADGTKVLDACAREARRFIHFDMQDIADRSGSVISSALLGAIAGAGVLPFPRDAFEDAIRRGEVGVSASLAAFSQGFALAQCDPPSPPDEIETPVPSRGPMDAQIAAEFPASISTIALEGARRCADYQDLAYANTYLERVRRVFQLDIAPAGREADFALTRQTARYLALWMSFEDTIRIGDLKTRASRIDRVRSDVKAADGQIVEIVEYMHPRYEELCDTLPELLGRFLSKSKLWKSILGPFFRHGRNITTTSLRGFLLLYFLASLRPWRRSTLRFCEENSAIEEWLAAVIHLAPDQYLLSVELAECPRLIKGYSATREQGGKNFRRIMSVVDRIKKRSNGATILRGLREAALKDEHGLTLAIELEKSALI